MLTLYLFSLLVGGVLLAISLAGADQNAGDGGIDGVEAGDNPVKFLSLRTITYFLFVFGASGSAMSWWWKSAGVLPVLAVSLLAGLGIAGLVAAAFAYLTRTESGLGSPESSFVGLPARVVLPIAVGGMGKVVVHRGDRVYELLARPLDASSTDSMHWKSVVVVEMSRGTAVVAPLDEPNLELEPSDPPSEGS
jgi:hypothetical protein